MKRTHVVAIVISLSAALGLILLTQDEAVAQQGMDHSTFTLLEGPFESGPEVTAACLTCHANVASDIMSTVHWTWEYENEVIGETVGKRYVINNYCIAIDSNEPRCTSCHIGYGWRDDTFDFENPELIDCLVCHDTTGTYAKFPTAAGNPVLGEPIILSGVEWPPVDLAYVAQNVGATSRQTCGSCHFTGGGGDGVKHGDLDTSLLDPAWEEDVHMSSDGLDFSCTDCHITENHNISGGRYVADAYTGEGATCENCHTAEPHADVAALNTHAGFIACQTCHIPEFARGAPSMMTWDWSQAGQPNPEGGYPWIVSEEVNGFEVHVYDSRKGSFTWEMDVQPEYFWSNGVYDYALFEEGVDPDTNFTVNAILGSREDGKIWPFKVFTGIQPYDPVNNVIGIPHLFPYNADDTTAFWKVWDMDLALQEGLAQRDVEYSGSYEQIESVMYWPITHQVAPAEEALGCMDCHTENGRLDFIALGYSSEEVQVLSTFPPVPAEPEPELTEEPTGEPPSAAPSNPIDQIPSTCVECHSAIVNDWVETPHAHAYSNNGFQESWGERNYDPDCLDCHTTGYSPALESYHAEGVACEACHGQVPEGHPAVAAGLNDAITACADCHTVSEAEFRASLHEVAGMTCTSCHYAHTNGLRFEDQVTQCLNCHSHQLDDFAHQSHVEAGLVCRDCHGYVNPDSYTQRPDGQKPTGHDFRVNVTSCLDCHQDIELVPSNVDDGFSRTDTEESILLGTEEELLISELQAEVETLMHEDRNRTILNIIKGAAIGLVVGGIGVFICRNRSFITARFGKWDDERVDEETE
nr:tetrathionate reductase family octaheme c-type cytochrome [Anaerolineae bacterium]